LPHNHKRSQESEARRRDRWQRQLAAWERQLTRVSKYDSVSRETISLSMVTVQGFEAGDPLVNVDRGEVLMDGYGRGILQRPEILVDSSEWSHDMEVNK
jgi:hypothetical protein